MKKDRFMFSIIIPVYNIANYISECIESILHQDYNNYEIILIDDGSSDISGKLCDEYALKKNNIKVIHKKNGGLSSARNAGIDIASGNYLMFIDGDDFLYNVDCLSKISNYINKFPNIDIVQYKMIYYYDENKKFLKLNDLDVSSENDLITILDKQNKKSMLSISACDKVIKTSIIKENNLYFENGLLSEDIDWSLKLYLKVNTIKILNEDIYVYRQQRKGSITASKGEKNSKDLYYIICKWYDYDYKNEKIKKLYYNYLSYQIILLVTIAKKEYFNKEEWKNIYYMLNILIKYDNNYKVKKFNNTKKILGTKISIYIMKIYLKLRNKGILKL